MPPAKRTTTATKKAEAAIGTAAEHVAEICRACWPNGWPHLSHSASCEHGTYVRDAAPADDGEKTPETPAGTEKAEAAPPAGDKTEA